MSETKTIKLRKPLTYGQGDDAVTVTELKLREATAGEYEAAEKAAGVYGTTISLIGLLSGVPVDVIDRMFRSQIDEAENFIGSFGEGAFLTDVRSEDEHVLQLIRPIKITAEESPVNVASLALCEPTNQQHRKAAAAGGPFAALVAMISMVAGVPKIAVRAMCARDFLAAAGYFNGFQVRRSPDSDD
ncbi:phage tail assembly protein [Pandoraea pnomenusa]|uniref:phage tail assembly protein n=1 Tax=Pandoraea pnomenusa TaxID=93220 RepID=UPI00333F5CB0